MESQPPGPRNSNGCRDIAAACCSPYRSAGPEEVVFNLRAQEEAPVHDCRSAGQPRARALSSMRNAEDDEDSEDEEVSQLSNCHITQLSRGGEVLLPNPTLTVARALVLNHFCMSCFLPLQIYTNLYKSVKLETAKPLPVALLQELVDLGSFGIWGLGIPDSHKSTTRKGTSRG